VPYQGLANLTPFAAQLLLLSDEHGGDVLTCVVKATFVVRPGVNGSCALAVADEQEPVCVAPVHYGDPSTSSVKYDAEVALKKLGTDVALIGHAYSQFAAEYLDVSLTVGPARAVVRVFGDRFWTTTLGRWTATPPQRFEVMPLVYERAFGGWDRSSPDPSHHEFEPRNPVGVGYVSRKHGLPREGAPLPNLENPYDPITAPTDSPAPAGFGFVGQHWLPRATYAGTYDDAWKTQRMPLLPSDFDPRFYNAAHPSLIFQGFLRGGEIVEVLNAWKHGPMRFALPALQPFTTLRMADGATQRSGMGLDTVIVDTEMERLSLVWRASLLVHKRVHDIAWVKAQLWGNGAHA